MLLPLRGRAHVEVICSVFDSIWLESSSSLRGSARLDSLLFSVGTSCPGSLSLASSSLLRYFACSGLSVALVVVLILKVLTLFRN